MECCDKPSSREHFRFRVFCLVSLFGDLSVRNADLELGPADTTVLHQPHVNAIIDIAYVPGTEEPPWLIEEYQPHCLEDKDLPFDVDVEDMVYQLVSGLKHYHDHGLVHRDVKPSNVVMHPIERPGKPTRYVYKFTDHGPAAWKDGLGPIFSARLRF